MHRQPHRRALVVLTLALSAALACVREPTAIALGEREAQSNELTENGLASPSKRPTSAAGAACEALDALDDRKAIPLVPMMAHHQKQNMRDHLVAVQTIVAGVASGDFAAVERAAARMGFSDEMGQTCTHMGAGAPGFAEQAIHFHKTADGIREAARANDATRVLTALDATLQTCTACHAAWKQHVVDDAHFAEITGGAASRRVEHPHHGAQR